MEGSPNPILRGNTEIDCEDWETVKVLGKGSYGTVFLVRTGRDETHLPSLLAVKSAPFSPSETSSSAALLLKESYVLNALRDCPFVIRSYGDKLVRMDDDDEDDTPTPADFNLFLEYAPLGTLGDPQGATPESEVRFYTKCILQGMMHIHRLGIVHCDLKPENVLLVPSLSGGPPVPKIADFGLARLPGEKLDTNQLRGTPMYNAPESISMAQYDSPCDVRALGCIVFELLTGRYPWESYATSLSSLLRVIAHTTVLPRGRLSHEASDFIAKCLIRDPDVRWTPEMLKSHPFLIPHSQMLKKERGVKRSRVGIPHYIPLEGERMIKKIRQAEAVEEVHHLPSYISLSSSLESQP